MKNRSRSASANKPRKVSRRNCSAWVMPNG
jgi:hypothetical protein